MNAAPTAARNSAHTPAKNTFTSFVKNACSHGASRRLVDAKYPAGEAENCATTSIGRVVPVLENLQYGHSTGAARTAAVTPAAAMPSPACQRRVAIAIAAWINRITPARARR